MNAKEKIINFLNEIIGCNMKKDFEVILMKHENWIALVIFVLLLLVYLFFALFNPFNDGSQIPKAEYFSFHGTFISGISIPILTLITIILLLKNYNKLKIQIINNDINVSIRDIENSMIETIKFKENYINQIEFLKVEYFSGRSSGKLFIIDEEKSKKSYFNYILREMKNIKTALQNRNNDNDYFKNDTNISEKFDKYHNGSSNEKITIINDRINAREHNSLDQYINIIFSMLKVITFMDSQNEKYSHFNGKVYENLEERIFNYFRMSLGSTEVILIHYIFYNNNENRKILSRINFKDILTSADGYYLFDEDKDEFLPTKKG